MDGKEVAYLISSEAPTLLLPVPKILSKVPEIARWRTPRSWETQTLVSSFRIARRRKKGEEEGKKERASQRKKSAFFSFCELLRQGTAPRGREAICRKQHFGQPLKVNRSKMVRSRSRRVESENRTQYSTLNPVSRIEDLSPDIPIFDFICTRSEDSFVDFFSFHLKFRDC